MILKGGKDIKLSGQLFFYPYSLLLGSLSAGIVILMCSIGDIQLLFGTLDVQLLLEVVVYPVAPRSSLFETDALRCA